MIRKSIIIPFHSNINLLTQCLDSLFMTIDGECEVIIVANNSNPKELDFSLEGYNCKLIKINQNLLYPKAINIGAKEAKGEYLIFCDADTSFTENWLHHLTSKLCDPSIGFVSAKLLDMQTDKIWEFGTTSSYYNFPHPFKYRGRDFELCKSDHVCFGACAACSAVRKDVFFSINCHDEEMVCSYSDLDLCIRLREIGLKTVCVADCLVYHQGNSTDSSGMSESLKEDTKGIYMAKHSNIPTEIDNYIKIATEYFHSQHKLYMADYFVLDMSTICNPRLYLDAYINGLSIKEADYYKKPVQHREMLHIDLLNHVPYSVRSYKMPILYFVDAFVSLKENALWKECRKNFDDIVVDRHANIELLKNI